MEATASASYAGRPPDRRGGALSLDFVNTVQWRGAASGGNERLTGYGELLHWAQAQDLLGTAETLRLRRAAKDSPEAASEVLRDAIALREALARLLLSDGHDRGADLALLNGLLARAPGRGALVRGRTGFAWKLDAAEDSLERPLWPLLWDAADLLTSAQSKRVKRCADRQCGWLFLDQSRGGGRRWCSMSDCGNRAKARRHYARHRGGQAGPASA